MKRTALGVALALFSLTVFARTAQAGIGLSAMRYWGRIDMFGFPAQEIGRPQDMAPDTEILQLIERYNPKLASDSKGMILKAILRSARKNGLDPLLVASVIAAESSFHPKARSHCNARGLMQLTKMVWPYVGVQDPYDPVQNIEGGCRFLSAQLIRFGRVDLTLAAYNAGPGIVGRLMRVPNYTETVHYVKKVSSIRAKLQSDFARRVKQCEAAYLLTHFTSSDPIQDFAHPLPGIAEWRAEQSWPPEGNNINIIHLPEIPIKGAPEPKRLPT